jgi:mRNA interferase RelE/StbE
VIRRRVARLIESVEKAKELSDIPGLKKLHGETQSFRARVGEYRVGFLVEGGIVRFVRCLHRKEIYRYFP